MRKVADSAIVELNNPNRKTSSGQTLKELGHPDHNSEVVMLARNGSLRGKPLEQKTIDAINAANNLGVAFVVGDMPDVDTQFIDHLISIGATFTVYHDGATPRISIGETKIEGVTPEIQKRTEDKLGHCKI
jgi:hypothetical protein